MKRLVPLMLVFGALIHAQTSGTISGAVHDATGAVVPGAAITATHIATNQSRSATTDSAGQYVLPLLPLGDYRVRVEKDGLAPDGPADGALSRI
jgi:hypothetical protein